MQAQSFFATHSMHGVGPVFERPDVGDVVYMGPTCGNGWINDVGVVTKVTPKSVTVRRVDGTCRDKQERTDPADAFFGPMVISTWTFVPDVTTFLDDGNVFRQRAEGTFVSPNGRVLRIAPGQDAQGQCKYVQSKPVE